MRHIHFFILLLLLLQWLQPMEAVAQTSETPQSPLTTFRSYLQDRAELFTDAPSEWEDIQTKLNAFNDSRKDGVMLYVVTLTDPILVREEQSQTKVKDLPFGCHVEIYANFRNLDRKAYIATKNSFQVDDQRVVNSIYRAFSKKSVLVYILHNIIFYNAQGKFKRYTMGIVYTNHQEKFAAQNVGDKIQLGANKEWVDLEEDGDESKVTSGRDRVRMAVDNIINIIHLDYDGNGATDKSIVHCDEEIEAKLKGPVIKGNTPELDRLYALAKTAANLLDNATPDQQYGSPHLVIDNPSLFKGHVRDLDAQGNKVYQKILPEPFFYEEILPDILNKIEGKYTVKVVCFSTNGLIIPDAQRDEFAENVRIESKVAQKPNTVLIVLPYYKCDENALDANTGWLMMPGANAPDEGMTSLMNNALLKLSIRDGLTVAIQQVPKRCRLYIWNILWNGDAVSIQPNGKSEPFILENTTGYNPVEVIVFQDTRLNEILTARKRCDGVPLYRPGEAMVRNSKWEECHDQLNAAVNQIMEQKPNFKQVKENTNLRMSAITWEVSRDFALAFGAMKIGAHLDMQDDLFYGGNNTVDKVDASLFFSLIDGASAVLALAGLDFITDAIGLYVALRVGDNTNAAIYSTALAIPVLSGAALKSVMKGTDLVVQLADKTYKTVARKTLHGVFYLKVATTELSELASFALKPAIVQRVNRYSAELPTLVEEVEKAILDTKYIERVTNETLLLDDYVLARNEGALTLKKYMDVMADGTLFDNVATLAFGEPAGIQLAALGREADILSNLGKIKPQDGWLDLVVHATPDHLLVLNKGKWEAVTRRDLKNYLKKYFPAFNNAKGIRLVCNETGIIDLAEAVANRAKKNVRIANVTTSATADGRIVAAETGGRWAELESSTSSWTTPLEKEAAAPEANKIPIAATDEKAMSLSLFGKTEPPVSSISKAEWKKGTLRETFVVYVGAEEVGSAYYENGFIAMSIDVMRGENDARLASGSEIFNRLYEEMGKKYGADQIVGIKGVWIDDTKLRKNLDDFNKAFQEYVSQGMDSKAAAKKAAKENTFTGVMSGKRGFTEASDIEGAPINGIYPQATVYFKRPATPLINTNQRMVLVESGSLNALASTIPSKDGYFDVVAAVVGDNIVYRYKSELTENFTTIDIFEKLIKKSGYKPGMPVRFILEAEEGALALNGPVQKFINKLQTPCEIYMPTKRRMVPTTVNVGEDIGVIQNSTYIRQADNYVDVFVHGKPEGYLVNVVKRESDGKFIEIPLDTDGFVDWLLQQPAVVEAFNRGTPFDIRLFSCHSGRTEVASRISSGLKKRGVQANLLAPDVAVGAWVDGTLVTNAEEGGHMLRFNDGKVVRAEEAVVYDPTLKTAVAQTKSVVTLEKPITRPLNDPKMITSLGDTEDRAILQAIERLKEVETNNALQVVCHVTEDGKLWIRACDGTCEWIQPGDVAKWLDQRLMELSMAGKEIKEVHFITCGSRNSPIQDVVDHMVPGRDIKILAPLTSAESGAPIGVAKNGEVVNLGDEAVQWGQYKQGQPVTATGQDIRRIEVDPDTDVLPLGRASLWQRIKNRLWNQSAEESGLTLMGVYPEREDGLLFTVIKWEAKQGNLYTKGRFLPEDGKIVRKMISEGMLDENYSAIYHAHMQLAFDKNLKAQAYGLKRVRQIELTWSKTGTPRQWTNYTEALNKGVTPDEAAKMTRVGQALQRKNMAASAELAPFTYVTRIREEKGESVTFIFSIDGKAPSDGTFR